MRTDPLVHRTSMMVAVFLACVMSAHTASAQLVAAVLPSSRSVQVGNAATAFAALINAGTDVATGCTIALATSVAVNFTFQAADATNTPTGTPNTAVDIPASGTQSFIVTLTPTAAFAPTDIAFTFACSNRTSAVSVIGLNTLLLSASDTPVPDIVALATTPTGDGILRIPTDTGNGAFAVSTVNVGAAGSITMVADDGEATLPVTIFLCQTDTTTGACINPTSPSTDPVTVDIEAGAATSFGVFVNASSAIPLDAAVNRIIVRFNDTGEVTRGSTSVALTTESAATLVSRPSRSTTIALTSDDRFLVAVNRETDSVSIIEVRDADGQDVATKLTELAVGREPRCVALHPDDTEAYVTNTVSGTVSVIALAAAESHVVAEIPVGSEPRGCAVTPNGTQLYVANHTAGTVSVIDTETHTVTTTVSVGGNPTALAITDNGDASDSDETVFVTDFYARLIEDGPGEGFDTGKQGRVMAFPIANVTNLTTITLSPLANVGFTGDRSPFCPQSNANVASDIFCPDVNAAAGSTVITQDPQGAFPNQLQAALIRNNRLFLPNIAAGPEPPIRFNVNVQALVHVVDTEQHVELPDLLVNLNQQVAAETQPTEPTTSLGRLFGNDLVAIDADQDGNTFLLVSRGGNYVFRAGLDTAGRLDLGAPNIIRLQTGNIPNGVVISHDGLRAYANNEVGVSVTAINLETNTVLERDIPSGEPPAPGTFAHLVLVGKLAFFTALGIPDNDIFETPIRDFAPLSERGKASDNAWSSCSSCHPDGLADGVTWLFPTGPRQTIPLDAFFAKDNPGDQRLSNWNAVRGSVTDFNNNSRNIQGGLGFAGNPPNPEIYNHGITQGASDALDLLTLWVQTVRAPILPFPTDPTAFEAGRTVFESNCATCHGGPKWTKSQVLHADNPAFDANPLGTPPGTPRDPGVTNAGAQIVSYTVGDETLRFLEDISTFDAADPIEIRAANPGIGTTALGGLGFNVASLLGIGYHAPYFHNGAAQTLEEVLMLHALDGGTIATILDATAQQQLLVFLNAIDGSTNAVRSATDDFRDAIAPLP